jgi:F-type H+-transporting ATPase subunit b
MELLAESIGLRPRHTRIAWAVALVALALLALAPDALGQEHGAEGGGSEEEEGGSFLVSPGLGLMIWTLILFGVTMFVLAKTAFPRIGEALEKRANAIKENIEASERQRAEADELLAEYRKRLTEAREQADDIAARARKAADAAVAEATADGKTKREELVEAARRDIEVETRRSLEQIRKEVADLTVLATEKVTRKSLDEADQRKLVEDALGEVDFSALAGKES